MAEGEFEKWHTVHVTDTADPNPVAAFRHAGDALKWADKHYPYRSIVIAVMLPAKALDALRT